MIQIPIGPEGGGQIKSASPQQNGILNQRGLNAGQGFGSGTQFGTEPYYGSQAGPSPFNAVFQNKAEADLSEQERMDILAAKEEQSDFARWEEGVIQLLAERKDGQAAGLAVDYATMRRREVERRLASADTSQRREILEMFYERDRVPILSSLIDYEDRQMNSWAQKICRTDLDLSLRQIRDDPSSYKEALRYSAFLIDTLNPGQDVDAQKAAALKTVYTTTISEMRRAAENQPWLQKLLKEIDQDPNLSAEDKADVRDHYESLEAQARSEDRVMRELVGEAALGHAQNELKDILRGGAENQSLGRTFETAEAKGFLPAGALAAHQKERAAAREAARWLKSPENADKTLSELLSLAEKRYPSAEGQVSGIGRLVTAELSDRQEKLKADPLGYVEDKTRAVVDRLISEGHLKTGEGPEAVQARVAVGRQAARQMGLDEVPQVLSRKEADEYRRQLEENKDPAERFKLLSGLSNDYGPHTDNLFDQLELPVDQRLALKLFGNDNFSVKRLAEKAFRNLGRRPDPGQPGQILAADRARAQVGVSDYGRLCKDNILAERASQDDFQQLNGFYNLCVATALESQGAGRNPEMSLKSMLRAFKENN